MSQPRIDWKTFESIPVHGHGSGDIRTFTLDVQWYVDRTRGYVKIWNHHSGTYQHVLLLSKIRHWPDRKEDRCFFHCPTRQNDKCRKIVPSLYLGDGGMWSCRPCSGWLPKPDNRTERLRRLLRKPSDIRVILSNRDATPERRAVALEALRRIQKRKLSLLRKLQKLTKRPGKKPPIVKPPSVTQFPVVLDRRPAAPPKRYRSL